MSFGDRLLIGVAVLIVVMAVLWGIAGLWGKGDDDA